MALTGSEPDLRLGDSGEGVMLLQVRLYGLGILRDFPDGAFGLSTENAVRQLQAQLGLDNDGVVGSATWQAVQYQESYYGIQYQWETPYDALDQLRYDLQNPQSASGRFGVLSGSPGQFTPASQGGLFDPQDRYVEISEDGQWRWDGYAWLPMEGSTISADAVHYGYVAGYDGGQGGEYAGTEGNAETAAAYAVLSEDGQWRWDGYDWQPVTATADVLSEDGQWRWDGYDWQPVEQINRR